MVQFLGRHIASVLAADSFKDWPVTRRLHEKDLDEARVYYLFKGRVLELLCGPDERVRTIFVRAEEVDGVRLSEIPFRSTRQQVLARLGVPSATSTGVNDPVLGKSGAWDRFERPGHALHIEYRIDADEIKQITWMRADAIP